MCQSKVCLCPPSFSSPGNRICHLLLLNRLEHSYLCQPWVCLPLGPFPTFSPSSIYHGYGEWKTSSCNGKGVATDWMVKETGYFSSSVCQGQLHISIMVPVPTREAHTGPSLFWGDPSPRVPVNSIPFLCLSSLG